MLVIQRERGSGTEADPVQLRYWNGAAFGDYSSRIKMYRQVSRTVLWRASRLCAINDRLVILDTLKEPRAHDHFHVNNDVCPTCPRKYFIDQWCALTQCRPQPEGK